MENIVKHNYKLSEEDKKDIVVEYCLNRSFQNVEDLAKKYRISISYIYRLVKSNDGQQILDRHIKESRSNFKKKLDLLLEKTYNKLNNALDTEEIKAKDLALIGAMTYDKSRLENNLSTSNNSISINIKVER